MTSEQHGKFLEWLHLEVDGELSVAERRQLEEHLSECRSCRWERGELRRLDALLAEETLPVRSEFRRQVMSSLPPAGWEAAHPKAWWAAGLILLALGGAAAALLGSSAAALEPAGAFVGAALTVLDLIQTSLLAGAGLLSASWRGLGAAGGSLFEGSVLDLVAVVLLVVGLDVIFLRMLLRRRSRSTAVAKARDGSRPE